MLELHCHTTFSDGTLTPTQLVQEAITAGVKAIAITDHDTLLGWDEARAAALGSDLEIIPGIELSTISNGKSLHILGFYPDRDHLSDFLVERLAGRHRRAKTMASKLEALGYPITLKLDGPMAPGRPHIAKALIDAGHVESFEEAFDRFLIEGKPAYVPYEKLDTLEGIQRLRAAGAIPVWAHPYLWKGGTVEQALPAFLTAGLMGLEVYHPSHMPHQRDKLAALCDRHNLLKTGGSDYHGPSHDPKGNHATALNQQTVPWEWLATLKAASLVKK
jgi:3',5'-nucleoside bisphosphate phosphatase